MAEAKKMKERQQAAAVQLVSLWAFFNAIAAAAVAFAASHHDVLVARYVWCSVLAAAAAALALLLPGNIRRALAYVAATFVVASHCIFAGFVVGTHVLPDDDGAAGQLSHHKVAGFVAVVTFAAGDVLCFLTLRLGGEDPEDE